MYWSAYMPINSAEAFANDGTLYNVSRVLTEGLLDKEKYQTYGPPFFSGANVFGQGAWFAVYTMTWSYVMINQWGTIKQAFGGLYRGLLRKESAYGANNDAHSLIMSRYREVPDSCFLIILLMSLVLGIFVSGSVPYQYASLDSCGCHTDGRVLHHSYHPVVYHS